MGDILNCRDTSNASVQNTSNASKNQNEFSNTDAHGEINHADTRGASLRGLPQRKSPRAKWHDYAGAEYFITICTKNRKLLFGEIKNGAIQLTEIGKCLKKQIEITEQLRDGDVLIPLYCIMPNHVHLIVILQSTRRDASNASVQNASNASDNQNEFSNTDAHGEINHADARGASLQRFGPQSDNLGAVVRGIKSAVTKYANENGMDFAWQSRYYDHIVRNQHDMNRIAEYIENNPAKWELDCFYQKNKCLVRLS